MYNVFFHERVVLVFTPLAVEQITTHMSDGPPISILNLGFLPLSNHTLLPIRFARIKSNMNDVFNQVSFVSLPPAPCPGENHRFIVAIVALVCRQWRVWIELHFRRMLETSSLLRACVRCGLATCSYTVITHLSRPAFVEAVMSH